MYKNQKSLLTEWLIRTNVYNLIRNSEIGPDAGPINKNV